jgi:hypothetical protein
MKRRKQKGNRRDAKEKKVPHAPSERTVRQHLVAKNQLERFLGMGCNSLFVFDKQKQATYEGTPQNVAVENRFYDLPPEVERKFFPTDEHDPQFIEHGLANVEGQFKIDLDEFLVEAETKGITNSFRAKLAPYVVIQSMRGREYRESFKQAMERTQHAIFQEWCKRTHPEIPLDLVDVEVEYDRNLLPLDQTIDLCNSNGIEATALLLCQHIWIVGVNRTMQPFYTSDNPVVRNAHVFRHGRSFVGFNAPGVEIAFPLTSTHILVMYERKHHWNKHGRFENCVVGVSPFQVEYFNALQVRQSYRQIYCGKNEFDQARGICKRFPDVCKPNRQRVKVEVTGDMIAVLRHQ